MSDQNPANTRSDQILDLLAQSVGAGLIPNEQAELDALLRESLDYSAGDFDEAAAAAAECFAAASMKEAMPEHLRQRCIGSARAVLSETRDSERQQESRPTPAPLRFTPVREAPKSSLSLGWLAAAACLVVAVFGWLPKNQGAVVQPNPWINTTSSAPSMLDERRAFIESHADVIVWDFAKWGEEYDGVTGDVVWDPATNVGYMRFKGLPANDPKRERYQLWIVDQARGTPLQVPPVDGGLFDIGSGTGEWVVKFHARLPVEDVFGFGITVEDPEGVVISGQERKAVVALKPQA